MKNAFLVLAFLLIVLALLGGPVSTTGSYVNPVKSQALRTASELNSIDSKVKENDFLIKLDKVLDNNGTPVLLSGRQVTLELDFSFLGESYFTRLDDYVKQSRMKAYLKVGDKIVESSITPSGFLKYTCTFRISEGSNGAAVLGYKTKSWDKNTRVLIGENDGLTVDSVLSIIGL